MGDWSDDFPMIFEIDPLTPTLKFNLLPPSKKILIIQVDLLIY